MSIPIMFSSFYDELGFIGLGPGRNALRPASLANPGNETLSTLRAYILPLSLLGLPLAGGLILAARRRFGLSPGRLATVLLVSLIPLSFVFAAGFARHVRILGRHLTPLFPFILLAEACALLALWKSGRLIGRVAAVLIVIAITLSSLENRFAFRHSKDDYRAAAALAQQALAHGKTVWWAASPDGAQYYRLPYATHETPGAALWIYGVPSGFTAAPDEIVFSKPDISDPDGSLARFIAARHYHVDATFQAFTIWAL